MQKLVFLYVKKHRLFLAFYLYCFFSWFWIFEIDLSKLASSTATGRLVQTFVIIVLTTLSAVIYTKSVRLLFVSLKKTKTWLVPVMLVMWWAATELFVAWAVSIVWYGVGARVDNVLPSTSLSHLGIWTPLGYLARIVGIHGLSGVMFMLLIVVVKPELRKLIAPVASVTFFSTLVAWGVYRLPTGTKVTAVVVSEQSEQNKYFDTVQADEGSIVVFPEYGFNGIEEDTISSRVTSTLADQKIYFVSSRLAYESDIVKNQLVAGDTKSGYVYSIDKSRLIPMGEYLPYSSVALLNIIGAEEVIQDFKETREITKAEGAPQQMLLNFGTIKVGAGVCSSIIAPNDYRTLAKNGANLFTNSAYLGIFNNSKLYHWQHRSMAKSMAVANARSFLQSATSGPSFGFDQNGKQLFNTETTGTTTILVDLNDRRTVYSQFGEYLGIGGIIWILAYVLKTRSNVIKRIKNKR